MLACARGLALGAVSLAGVPAPVESAVYFAVAEALANVFKHSAADRAWVHLECEKGTLTARERAVLALMAEGHANAGIAGRLVVTEKAVSKHINSIFTKLELYPAEDGNRRVLAVLTCLST